MSSNKMLDKVFEGISVIRFRLKELLIEREFKAGKKITFDQVSVETGINKSTLSRISSIRGYNTTTDNIDKLCRYFNCSVSDLMQYVPDEEVLGVKVEK